MTSPAIPQRFVAALAAAVHEARASLGHPAWDEPGIAAVIRQLGHVSLADQLVTFGRALADPTNETPAAVLHPNNRAWDTDTWASCPTHAPYSARRTDGECGQCYADRISVTEPQPLRRKGVEPTGEQRASIYAAIGTIDAVLRRTAHAPSATVATATDTTGGAR